MKYIPCSSVVTDGLTKNKKLMDVRVINILLRVEKEFGFSIESLRGKARNAEIATARFEAMLRLKEGLGLPSTQIGKIFNRNHATVLHGFKIAEERRAYIQNNFTEEDVQFRAKLIEEKCRLSLKIRDIDRMLALYEREPTIDINDLKTK